MRKYSIDTVFRVRLTHRTGQLARLASTIADEGGLLGDITTVLVGEEDVIRDITVETTDDAHTQLLVSAIEKVEGVEILKTTDRVFEMHRGGKLHNGSKREVRKLKDLRTLYTPGVARMSLAIAKDPECAREFTGIGNTVGIFTNGSRVLGLGNIGPVPSLPVMEGKAVLYDKFSGISAIPVLVDSLDPDTFIETVIRVAPTFGAIHLEDIRIPDCFRIERELDRRLDKPVMHDDQHGTATAALAAIINACKMTGKDLRQSRLGQVGLGAAGRAIASLALAYGARDVLVTDIDEQAMIELEGKGARRATLEEIMQKADIVIATTGRPGLIHPSLVKKNQVIFALSNPEPEIAPEQARAAGAAFAGDGRSINNALAFPGLFKGALEVKSRAITKEMLLAAAETIAGLAEPGQVVPSPLNLKVHEEVKKAVISKAREQNLADTARV